ncbi:MAG: hypothetical protein ABTQ28_09825, partial [Thauera sp.]
MATVSASRAPPATTKCIKAFPAGAAASAANPRDMRGFYNGAAVPLAPSPQFLAPTMTTLRLVL